MILETSKRALCDFNISGLLTLPPKLPGFVELPDVSELEAVHAKGIHSKSMLLMIQTLRPLLRQQLVRNEFAQALLVHAALVSHLPLSARRPTHMSTFSDEANSFLKHYCQAATSIIYHQPAQSFRSEICDIADFVDGRLLLAICEQMQNGVNLNGAGASVQNTYRTLCHALDISPQATLRCSADLIKVRLSDAVEYEHSDDAMTRSHLLPFSDPTFDEHLASVRVNVDQTADSQIDSTIDHIFKELSHWHNTRLLQLKSSKSFVDQWQRERALRRNQMFMNAMTTYAASLTNAVGKMLVREIIIANEQGLQTKISVKQKQKQPSIASKPTHSLGQSKKTEKLGVRKKKMLDSVAATNSKKEQEAEGKYLASWMAQLNSTKLEKELTVCYERTYKYWAGLSSNTPKALRDEVQLYMLNILLRMWSHICKTRAQSENMNVAALMWNHINQLIGRSQSLDDTILLHVKSSCKWLGFAQPEASPQSQDRKLSFRFYEKPELALTVSDDPKIFQLEHCGPYMDRNIDSAPDERTDFSPDRWQRDVLDAIDENKSLFVVAPTSAGKTFISFYAMKKILRADDDGVIVYVAPTKALVNQIAAEIEARFRKSYKTPKSVWALHTRDFRVNSPTGCQILVTVPHILQIMLLSPSNAQSWSPRVRRIIFDEIHSIGQADDGIVWEQLLLLAPCPIIALSATVGNPDEFSQWLESTQRSLRNDLVVIQHAYRYSDLRKYIFSSPASFTFQGLSSSPAFGELGLDNAKEYFCVMHPISSLVDRSKAVPADLHMEPRECLSLWKALKTFQTPEFPVDPALAPSSFFNDIICKKDTIKWDAALKLVLSKWMSDPCSPFAHVFGKLSAPTFGRLDASPGTPSTPSHGTGTQSLQASGDTTEILQTVLPLLVALHSRNALPGILFNYERRLCEKIGHVLLDQLRTAEGNFKESNPSWKRKVGQWEAWNKAEASKVKALTISKSSASRKGKSGDDSEKESKADRARGSAESDESPIASFDPHAPLEAFTFANKKVLTASELDEHTNQLRKRDVAGWLCDALVRGIGIHHAGMPRLYRQAVEILFRKGFLRVVIATGTLALGINMPCKTVVFTGDSIFLTALNFRQAAGRAGRRGFDLLGNVVFHALPTEKARRLVSSRLPSLNGHFPITTSLVLRLFILLHGSDHSSYAEKAINSLLSQPRLFLGGQSFKDQVSHHLRFSIEYLRRARLLDVNGKPINFAGCVSHLYFTENASFAMHALLKRGYFHNLLKNMHDDNEEDTLRTTMLVMAHLFGRKPLRQADVEPSNIERRIKPSPSVVLLPNLPADALEILRKHNRETLNIFAAYVRTFAEQHLMDEDNELPLSKAKYGGSATADEYSFILKPFAPTIVRSHFVALSGHDDCFTSITSLCNTARSGVFLEESVIPHLALYPDEMSTPLNAYLYDFYKHGDTTALEKANGIRKGDMWFLLNDFSLVLATIVTSLKNIMNIGDNANLDLANLQGNGDAVEESLDEQASLVQESTPMAVLASSGDDKSEAGKLKSSEKKTTVPESWEDEDAARDDHSSIVEKEANDPASVIDQKNKPDRQALNLPKVLKAFERLQYLFNDKFRAMWA